MVFSGQKWLAWKHCKRERTCWFPLSSEPPKAPNDFIGQEGPEGPNLFWSGGRSESLRFLLPARSQRLPQRICLALAKAKGEGRF